MCGFPLKRAQKNQSRLLTVYSCGCAGDYSQEWMADTCYVCICSSLTLTLFLCVCVIEAERKSVFFWCEGESVVQVSLSVSVVDIHSEVWKLSGSKVESPSQISHRIFVDKQGGFPAFWYAVSSSSSMKHKHTHLSYYTSDDLHWQRSLFKP